MADPTATLRRVNALRASFGARPLRLVRAWSNGCARHIAYTRQNPFGHAEVRGRPGYSASGALAGATSVLVSPPEEPFASRLGAWADEPYHQVQVLNPRLARTGFALGCMNTTRGVVSAAPRLLAWPGAGSTGVPRSIDACDEIPSDPFTDIGWSCDRSGAALYVYARGARCTGQPAVRLSPPLPVTVERAGSCAWIGLTPAPLPPGAVRMDVSLGAVRLSHTFSTAGAPRAPCCPAAAGRAADRAARPARWPAA